ncbi:hypothetical protein AYO21_04627 [Fonsecaea monophora]|uniref:RING-type domain-containing protein n=1 Tax=Fonsecaea monophora TaxID=254056 RepID=A0A177FAE7_9EURO|nr:hypothetical protein AYO21_04627 [Fonsecaea monophora]OAG41247.1 hypothetical protein AYO21_04627 [Fonsecaea monophora]
MSDGPQSATTPLDGFDAHSNARDIVRLFQFGDCAVDVTLKKIGHLVNAFISNYVAESLEIPLLLEERLNSSGPDDTSTEATPHSHVISGGRIAATYMFADMGELNYHSTVSYTTVNTHTAEAVRAADVTVLEKLQEAIRPELECQVCYQIMLDPLTTSCGHTFCRRCFCRAMDHTNHCPMCRRLLPLVHSQQTTPNNKRVARLIQHLFPDLLVARKALAAQEDMVDEETQLPLFPCTLVYPQMPTFLHIFEPRYRLMVRRVLENGTRKFGMLAYKPHSEYQQGGPHWQEYGTVLFVERVEMLADGRSLLETRGLYKFRVVETGMVDGYLTGRIQRYDDISVHEEEAIEARETGMPIQPDQDDLVRLHHSSTQQLLDYGLEFVRQAQARSARWLHQRVLAAYGQPPEDAATFPYWLASVLPIAETEKYALLPAAGVRERLKITAEWIYRLEQARCEYEAELAAKVREQQDRHQQETRDAVAPTPPAQLEPRSVTTRGPELAEPEAHELETSGAEAESTELPES